MVLLMFLAIWYEVSGIWLVSLFLSYLMSLGIRELAHRQGIGPRITEDHGISGWV